MWIIRKLLDPTLILMTLLDQSMLDNRGHILRDVVTRGLVLTAIGLVMGLAGAYAATTLLESYLYELDVHDPTTFALATLALLLAALLAATLPARRAARVDPVIALRAE